MASVINLLFAYKYKRFIKNIKIVWILFQFVLEGYCLGKDMPITNFVPCLISLRRNPMNVVPLVSMSSLCCTQHKMMFGQLQIQAEGRADM